LMRAFADGASTLSELKAWTRVGMGACQSRMCGSATAHVLARCVEQSVESLGCYTPRPPIKPVLIDTLISDVRAMDAGANPGQRA
jgi:hypothetical protein